MASLRSNPRISMQKEEVSAVMAPSTEGNKAEINPTIKIIKIPSGRCCWTIVGKTSSGLKFSPC